MKSKIRNKFIKILVALVAVLGLMPISANVTLADNVQTANKAPKISYKQQGGEVIKKSNDFIDEKTNPEGLGTVEVTATDPDGDGIVYIYYQWDHDLTNEKTSKYFEYTTMNASQTVAIKVPQTNGLHVLRVCAKDQYGAKCNWLKIPYYIVDEFSTTPDTTAPQILQDFTEELPRTESTIDAARNITVRARDNESGIYYIAYAWTKTVKTEEGIPTNLPTSYNAQVQPLNNAVTFTSPKEPGNWTLWVYAANSTYQVAKQEFMTSNLYYFDYKIEDQSAPSIELVGQDVINLKENETYTDEGAFVTDNCDSDKTVYCTNIQELVNKGIVTVDGNKYTFTKRGEYTLNYQATDNKGNVSKIAKRNVKVEGENELIILTLPTKTEYNYKEEISLEDLKGASIKVTTVTGEIKNVDVTTNMFTGLSTDELGEYTATFTYKGESKIYAYSVNNYVKEVQVVPPTKTEYNYNEDLDLTGGTVKKIMANGDYTISPISTDMLVNEQGNKENTYNKTAIGEQTIRVLHAGKIVSFKVTVKDLSAPILTVNENTLRVPIDTQISEDDLNDYTATDDYDTANGIAVKVTVDASNVNTSRVGTYEIIYTAQDSNKYTTTKTRQVEVYIPDDNEDLSDLNEIKEKVEELRKNEEDYTPESWNKIEEALKLPENTTKEIKDKIDAIQNAIDSLESKELDKKALQAIEEKLEGIDPNDYTEESLKAIKDKIAEANKQTLQSKLDEIVESIDLSTLVLKAIISDVQISTSNSNRAFAKLEDTITVTFNTNVALDLNSTELKLNDSKIQIEKIQEQEVVSSKDEPTKASINSYKATCVMDENFEEGEITYSIFAVEARHVEENEQKQTVNANGNTNIIFDKTAPTGTFAKDFSKPVAVKSTYAPEASDLNVSDVYTDKESIIIDIETNLDINTVGTYKVKYTVKDLAGNEIVKTRNITVADLEAPVITLNGDNPVILELGDSYEEKGATVTDNYDTNPEVKISGDVVDTSVATTYTVIYNVTDNAGNSAEEVTRTVRVLNKEALKDAISKKEDLKKDDYTENAWKELEDALDMPETTQQEVDDKTTAINQAVENLKNEDSRKELDTTRYEELKAIIKELKTHKDDYENWKNLEDKSIAAKQAETTGLQSKLDPAVEELAAAIDGLIAKEVDQSALQPIENELNALVESDYTPESWAAAHKAIDDAKAIKDLQNKFDEAVDNINLDNILVAKELDKTALNAIIAEVKTLNKDDYTEDSWKAVGNLIAQAKAQTLQSKLNEAVSKIDLNKLVLKPVISNVQITNNNAINQGYVKEGDIVTITFESNTVLDVAETKITLDGIEVNAKKVEGEENKYQASFTLNDQNTEGKLAYAIHSVEDKAKVSIDESGEAQVIFDKESPNANFKATIEDVTTVEVFDTYTVGKEDISINDNYTQSKDLDVKVETTLDTNVLGEYNVTYTVKDLAGNVKVVTRKVKVVDTEKPVITLKGDAEVILEANKDTYTELGATVTDNYDKNIEVVISQTVDTTVAKTYIIEYTAKDSSDNEAIPVTRKVRVLDKAALNAIKEEAASLLKKDYTPETWAVLEQALEIKEISQTSVNNKVEAIRTAIDGLVKAPFSSELLEKGNKLIDEVDDLTGSDYTTETWGKVEDKKAELQEAINANPQTLKPSELDKLIKELQDAVDGLQTDTIDQSALQPIENELNSLVESDYTPESWAAAHKAIDDAKAITDLQSKFDKAVENIDLDNILVAKELDKTALNEVITEFNQLKEKEEYTTDSLNTVQNAIDNANAQTLQSKLNEAVEKINLSVLVAIAKVSNITVESNNENSKYVKVGETITLTFDSNVELDVAKTGVRIANISAKAQRIISDDADYRYQATVMLLNEGTDEGKIKYAIFPAGLQNNSGTRIENQTDITFDKTAPTIKFANGVGDKTIKYGNTTYKPSKNDVIVSDANPTEVMITPENFDSEVIGQHVVVYTAVDAAGNTSIAVDNDNNLLSPNILSRTITVEDYVKGIKVVNKPNKETYKQDEVLDVSGGMIQFEYASGIDGQILPMQNNWITGFNSTNPGIITLVVNYNLDGTNLQATFEVIILDSEKPTIILNGEDEITLEAKRDTYKELGATVEDNIDKNLVPEITGEVNTDKVGTYKVYYNVTDTAGNKADTVVRTVYVKDRTKPVITGLKGDNPVLLEAGSDYVESGAMAFDTYDGDISNRVQVVNKDLQALKNNINKVGTYTLRYYVEDSHGNNSHDENTQYVTRTVIIGDTTKPVITLNGDSEITIEVGSIPGYVDQGATFTDNGDTTGLNIVTIGDNLVNTAKVGIYQIRYNVMDKSGNAAEEVIRTVKVVDTTKPVITLEGSKEVTIEVGSTIPYVDAGATASDNYDGNITAKIITDNKVDTSKVGEYTITYNVTDANGNAADEVTRTVYVKDTTPPRVTLIGGSEVTIIAGQGYEDPGITITDTYDAEENCTTVITCKVKVNGIMVKGEFNPNKEGEYELTYVGKDSSGNSSNAVTRKVIVQAVPPTISFVTEDGNTELTNGTVFRKDTIIGFDKGTLEVVRTDIENAEPITITSSDETVKLTDGEYKATATDISGSKTEITFTVDSTPPVVELRTGYYKGKATIKFEDINDVASAILVSKNGATQIKDKYSDEGITITEKGAYSLFVFDKNDNYTRVDFEII